MNYMPQRPVRRAVHHRYLFAIRPDAATAERLHRYCAGIAGDAHRILREDFHITMAVTDDYPTPERERMDRLLAVGAAVAAPSFDVVLDRTVGTAKSVSLRPNGPQPGLRALQKRIDAAMRVGEQKQRAGWSFSPHVTLHYGGGAAFQQRHDKDPFRWTAQEFVLIHSFIGLTRHEILGRWKLKGAVEPDGQLAMF